MDQNVKKWTERDFTQKNRLWKEKWTIWEPCITSHISLFFFFFQENIIYTSHFFFPISFRFRIFAYFTAQEKLLAVKLLTKLRKIENCDDHFTYSVPFLNGIQSYSFKINVSKINKCQSLFCHESE